MVFSHKKANPQLIGYYVSFDHRRLLFKFVVWQLLEVGYSSKHWQAILTLNGCILRSYMHSFNNVQTSEGIYGDVMVVEHIN